MNNRLFSSLGLVGVLLAWNPPPLIGLFVAFVSAMAAVKWMVAWLNEKGFEIFGWYRIAVGLLAFALLAAGAIG